jgi:hypothetical protein
LGSLREGVGQKPSNRKNNLGDFLNQTLAIGMRPAEVLLGLRRLNYFCTSDIG